MIIGKVPVSADVSIRSVRKNNGVCLDGLTIMEEGDNIAPTFYLQNYYERYRNGADLAALAGEILWRNEQNSLHQIDVDALTSYEAVKSRLCIRLVNYDMNAVLVQDLPHLLFLDLAVLFYYKVDGAIVPDAACLIQKEQLADWGISLKDLAAAAFASAILTEPPRIASMGGSPEMYIITNASGLFGASVITYPEIGQVLAERFGEDMILIPSSIHELIAVPKRMIKKVEELECLIQEVNAQEVAPEEVLSSHPYVLLHDTGEIRSCREEAGRSY